MLGITLPLQNPTKTIPSNTDSHKEPNTSKKVTFQDKSSGVFSHQFQLETDHYFFNLIEAKELYLCIIHLLII